MAAPLRMLFLVVAIAVLFVASELPWVLYLVTSDLAWTAAGAAVLGVMVVALSLVARRRRRAARGRAPANSRRR